MRYTVLPFLPVYSHSLEVLNVGGAADGRRCDAAVVLENQTEEYSYPAVIRTAEGIVHATYRYGRKQVRHVVIDPTLLKPGPIRNGEGPQQPPETA